jgi:hypothetical protein
MPRSTDALRNPISVKKLAVPIVLKTAVELVRLSFLGWLTCAKIGHCSLRVCKI